MPPSRTDFPAVRACIFDMDGLLVNSEDKITCALNKLLRKYGRPDIPRELRVKLMGVPHSTSSDTFHDWAQLPIDRHAFKQELGEEMKRQFMTCEPMPGAEKLLSNLSRARTASGESFELALASSTTTNTYELKVSQPKSKRLLGHFTDDRRVLGDDSRIKQGRGKPAPDNYLVALQALNASMDPARKQIQPDECLVFEDSVTGVESGRRAGMRVIWVPHPDVAIELKAVEKEVLAGRSGTSNLGDEWQLGQIDDGWAESIPSLEHFDHEKYGIQLPS